MKLKKTVVWLCGFFAVVVGIVCFVALLYQLEVLHDAGKPIYQKIDAHGFDDFKIGELAIFLWALIVAFCLIVMLQFFKSLFDQSIKIIFDKGAAELVNKFKTWVEK